MSTFHDFTPLELRFCQESLKVTEITAFIQELELHKASISWSCVSVIFNNLARILDESCILFLLDLPNIDHRSLVPIFNSTRHLNLPCLVSFYKLVVVSFYNNSILEKRLLAANFLKEIFKLIDLNPNLGLEIANWLIESNFIENTFGQTLHVEIIQRVSGAIPLLIKFNLFSKPHFDMVWSLISSDQHQTLVHAIFRMLD